ncbi:MAG: polysaccharide deacetylase family protein [Myxococcales bacterium]|nr:polysaccharide deacetylase family protein [Myxococcales bacterium]MCB9715483.1 polysaccharide deacetylase family protein [Myxococcales bacterium]
MSSPPATLVSVDLDDAACYHAIHGLPPPDPEQARAALERWLPRFLELFARARVHATFFVIGRELRRDADDRGRGAELLRRALAEGHELGNHGHAHAYDLVRWPAERQRDDLRACDAALRELGATVEGFRAPGYTHDAELLRRVVELGYRYDSSCLPSPAYYATKLAVMGAMALRGERSSSLATGGRSFVGPVEPYRRRDVPLWELPMSVSPHLRLPLIGTFLLAGPGPLSAALRRAALRLPRLHLELHAIDLADPERDPIAPVLVERQPELKVPWRVRHERLWELLRRRGGGTTLRSAIPRDEPS